MASPQIAAHTPTACAACWGQYPERVHVDFRSAIEGPLVDPANPRGPRIDWVVMCEDCVRAAHDLLPEVAAQREALERQVAQLTQRAEEAENYAATLEDALAHRPDFSREPRNRESPPRAAKARARSGHRDDGERASRRRNRYQRGA